MCADRGALFSSVSDFRGDQDFEVDFIFAHSVLTHVSDHELRQFMQAIADQLEPTGKALVSVVLGETDTHAEAWTYPDFVTFSWSALIDAAAGCQLNIRRRTRYDDLQFSWVVLTCVS